MSRSSRHHKARPKAMRRDNYVPNPCPSGKRGFTSRAEARRGLKRARGTGAEVRDTYRCEDCGLWHMTSQDKDLSRARRREQA